MSDILQADEERADGLRRIATLQVEQAIAAFSNKRLQRNEAVHQARVQCKKLRALLQLLGVTLPEVARFENASIRDAAAQLAHIRDADALAETFEAFKQHAAECVSSHVLHEVHQILTQRRQLIAGEDSSVVSRIEGFISNMKTALDRVRSWPLALDGISDVMLGFAKSHQRGRSALKACRQSPLDEAFHHWRKWTKYQFYQSNLLVKYLKGSLKRRIGLLDRLGKLLGVDHDLAVLRHEMVEAPDFRSVRQLSGVGGLLQAVDRRRRRLQERSFELGKRVFSKEIERRIRACA